MYDWLANKRVIKQMIRFKKAAAKDSKKNKEKEEEAFLNKEEGEEAGETPLIKHEYKRFKWDNFQ